MGHLFVSYYDMFGSDDGDSIDMYDHVVNHYPLDLFGPVVSPVMEIHDPIEHSEFLEEEEITLLSDESDGYSDDDDPDYEPTQASGAQDAEAQDTEVQDTEVQDAEVQDLMETQENDDSSQSSTQEGPPLAASNCTKSPKPEVEKRNSIASSQRSSDEDSQNCTICFEPWTSSSEHRLVSLRCGHLFGRSCITRWLKGQNARCPQCNARARKSEIRNIYAKLVKVLDTSERDRALDNLAKEVQLRKVAERNAAEERLKHTLAIQECERLKAELIESHKQLKEFRLGIKRYGSSQAAKNKPSFSLAQNINVSKNGGCRILDTCELLGMILVSQPSPEAMFPGFGFRKISTMDMKKSEFVFVHTKLIRDMAFHTHDGLVLTASVDKSLKITNVLSNTVVQTYKVDSEVWSCSWDADNSVYFYGGLKTGEVYVFDIRMTNKHINILPQFGTKTPVVSVEYLRSSSASCLAKFESGPVVAKLSDCGLHQKIDDGDYKYVPMPALGPFTCLSADTSGHLLVSCRPSPKVPCITHTLCDFIKTASGDLACYPIKTVNAGRTQLQLTRSKLLSHPDDESSVLICAGDEDARGALIWDGSSGQSIDNLKTDSSVLDIAGMKLNHKNFLMALTSNDLNVYGWNSL